MQKRNKEALVLINETLTQLIAESKAVLDAENLTFDEEDFLSKADPSILHFLIASGDNITSKQLRDDLMTLLIAGHETTAAVLTWTTHLLVQHPEIQAQAQREVRLCTSIFQQADSAMAVPPVHSPDLRDTFTFS
jgi:beta-ring hydroxylase